MADIAQIGFSANTSELVDAKAKLEQLSPAAGRAEASARRLATIFKSVDAATTKLTNAAMALSAAAEKMSAAIGNAANSNNRNKAAVEASASATQKATAVSNAAAAAAKKEAVAVNEVAAAHDRASASKRRSVSVPSVGGGSGKPGPWGMPAANSNIPGKAGGGGVDGILAAQSTPSNIAAQFQDIGVTAAMGMNPLLIALQQGTQLSMAFAGGLQQVGSALRMMLGPTAILTIAAVGLGAALLQAIDWVWVGQTALNGLADAMEAIGPYVIGLAGILALLYAPQIILGIMTVIAAIARMGVAALAAGAQMAAAWLIGMGPIAWIIAGIAAIVIAANLFRDELTKILGVDIVAAAKDGVNFIIGSFVGGYEGIKQVWSMLPSAIGDIAIQVANNVIKSIGDMINKAIELINGLVNGLPEWMRPTGGLISWRADFSGFSNQFAGAAAKAGETLRTEMDKAIGPDYVGAMGDAVVGAVSTVADKIRKLSDGLGATDDKKKKKGGGGKTDGEKFEDIVNGAERTIATLQAERDAIGLSEEATARLKYQTDLLNQAKQKNINLSPEQRAQLLGLADDMAKLEVSTKKAKEALDFAKDITKGFITDLRDGLKNGESFWDAFSNAALNALDKITDKLLNDVINALFEVNKEAGAGGAGGGVGGFIKGLFDWMFNAKGNAFNSGGVMKFAKGGTFTNSVVSKPTMFANGGKLGVMGEAGPEAIMPLKRGPSGSLGVEAHGMGSSGPAVTVQVINNAPNTAIREERAIGGDGQEIRRLIIDEVKRATANGDFDDVNGARYNNKVQKVAR